MRRSLTAAAAVVLCGAAAAASVPAPAAVSADSLDRQVAVFVASNIKLAVNNALADLVATGVDCDTAAVRRMVIEELALPYDRDAHAHANEVIDRAMNARAIAESGAMLAAAAAVPGAVVTPTGLVFETIVAGDGATPAGDSTVLLRYRGILPDGTVFDSIGPADEPMEAAVAELTPGLTEGLLMMRKGGSYRLTLPPSLAYGSEGVPGVIPPDCAIQFDVQLIDIK